MVYRTTPKMAKRKLERRQKLLKVAVGIFGKRGYHQTTVPMIVTRSGGSIGSFYMYFRNKENIFAAVIEAIGAQISDSLNEAIAKAPTQEITVGSWTFQPLIQSQRVKSTSPKAVMKVKSKLVFGRMYGPKPPIIQPNPAMNNAIPNIHGM
jgi:AcrR family transcriptional regulator